MSDEKKEMDAVLGRDAPDFEEDFAKHRPTIWKWSTRIMWALVLAAMVGVVRHEIGDLTRARNVLDNHTEVSAVIRDIHEDRDHSRGGQLEGYNLDVEFTARGNTYDGRVFVTDEEYEADYEGAETVPLIYWNEYPGEMGFRDSYENKATLWTFGLKVFFGGVIAFAVVRYIRRYVLKLFV